MATYKNQELGDFDEVLTSNLPDNILEEVRRILYGEGVL